MNCKHRINIYKLLFGRDRHSRSKLWERQSVLDEKRKRIVQVFSCFISFFLTIPLVRLFVTLLPPIPGTNSNDFIRTLLIIFIFHVLFCLCSHFGYKIILRIGKFEE